MRRIGDSSGESWHMGGRMVPFIISLILLLSWEFLSRMDLIPALFFPPPSSILDYVYRSMLNGELPNALGFTLRRLAIGFLLGAVPGLVLGLGMGWSRRLRVIVDPFIAAFYPIPKIAILPLIMLIFGIGETSKILVISVSAFFPVLINTIAGVRQIPPVYLEIAQNYGAGWWKTLWRVVFPGSLPMTLAGIKIAVNTSLLIVIAVELIAANNGLGVMIWFAWQTLRIQELYAVLLVIALVGIGFDIFMQWISGQVIPWQSHPDSQKAK